MTNDEKIAVIAAYRDGARVQFKTNTIHLGCGWIAKQACDWTDDNQHDFNFSLYDYRIAPEPPPKPGEWTLCLSYSPPKVISNDSRCSKCVQVREICSSDPVNGHSLDTSTHD